MMWHMRMGSLITRSNGRCVPPGGVRVLVRHPQPSREPREHDRRARPKVGRRNRVFLGVAWKRVQGCRANERARESECAKRARSPDVKGRFRRRERSGVRRVSLLRLSHSLSCTHTRSLARSLSCAFSRTFSLALSLSHALSRTHSLARTLSHALSRTRALSRPTSLPLSRERERGGGWSLRSSTAQTEATRTSPAAPLP